MPQISKEAAEAEAEKQRQLILDQYIKDAGRLNDMTFRIFTANADLCKERTRPISGAYFIDKSAVTDDFAKAISSRFRIDAPEVIATVAAGSPADNAGLKAGDGIIKLNNWDVPRGRDAGKKFHDKFLEFAKDNKPVDITVRDATSDRTITITPVTACDFDVGLVFGDDVNAFADGKMVAFYTGMLRFASTDEELATVVSHETAHNLMNHIDKQRGNAFLGILLDILAAGVGVNTQGAFGKMAALAYSQEFEAEADYVGLYLMARAGYKIEDTPNFWRRMAIAHPSGVNAGFGATHPSTPERFLALEKTVAEIDSKRAAGQPVVPEAEVPEKKVGATQEEHAPWQ
ncbi:MAG: M48 family metallopeptidase [Alphaproteobacteria bacterium]